MQQFNDFLAEQTMKPKYIAVQYDEETQAKLRKWAQDNGFDLTTKFNGDKQRAEDFDFHTTIFYSTSKHDLKNETVFGATHEAKVVGIDFLGPDKDVPVLKVEGDAIREIRKHYETMGLKDQWPSYQPHVSLSYARDNLPSVDDIKLPDFPLKHRELKIEDASEL